jgi:ATP-dependent Clp protease ATP-binding subunit ClpC
MLDDVLRPAGPMLERFTRDLTADARAGRLDPVRCRADEIARLIDIILRHGKNNAALVGPAGVGKTAIVEGLAIRVADGGVPLALRGVRVLALDHVSLVAGTTYRGQYEERVRSLVEECTSAPDIVLFIDELHNLIGQGTTMGSAMDAGNMLKPALVRGDFRVIGATTDDEYERWICADPALERRFQKVTVRELSAEATAEILVARVPTLERHHNVVIAADALSAALELSDAYVLDRMRPDRAIDVLDEACAHAHAHATYTPDTERLIRERREAVRQARVERMDAEAARERAPRADARPYAAGATAAGAAERTPADPDGDDALGRMARDGMAALERFGAELEQMLGVTPPEARERAERGVARPTSPRPSANTAPAAARLAELDARLARQLMEEGAVVRGHDVARVVAVATGSTVRWPIS